VWWVTSREEGKLEGGAGVSRGGRRGVRDGKMRRLRGLPGGVEDGVENEKKWSLAVGKKTSGKKEGVWPSNKNEEGPSKLITLPRR